MRCLQGKGSGPIFRVREANVSDAPGMARIRVDTWRATYPGIVPDKVLANLSYQETAGRWKETYLEEKNSKLGIFVAEATRGKIVGIAMCGPEQNHDAAYGGEIYVLYVLPRYQHRGIGRKLVAACVEHLLDQLRIHTMLIWVIAANPYRRFYEALGGRPVREKNKEIGGRMILEVGYGWEDIESLRSPASD